MLSNLLIVLPIFALIFAGWLARRGGALGPAATREMNRFVVYLALPALLFEIMANAAPEEIWRPGFILAFSGGCALVCPKKAILEVPREIGVVETGRAGRVRFVRGVLNVGEAKSPPVIRAVRAAAPDDHWQIIDAPPGTSCPVVTTVRDTDFVLLVTEPTPFGLHDLTLAVQTLRQVGVPMGVVINRADVGDERVATYCAAEGIPVLLTIRDDRGIAEAYSRGELLVTARPDLRAALAGLWEQLERVATAQAKASHTA